MFISNSSIIIPVISFTGTILPLYPTSENIYTVAFPYESAQEGQLSLHKGDKLQLVETAENGWWRGVSIKKGKIWLVPEQLRHRC